MRPPELQQDPNAASRMLRLAIDADRVRRVLRLAGADEVVSGAADTLRDVAADSVARRLFAPGAAAADARTRPLRCDANTVEEARGSTKRAYVELAVHLSGSPVAPDAVQQALVHEIAALAERAVAYARTDARAVDPPAVAVAAARLGDDPPGPILPSR